MPTPQQPECVAANPANGEGKFTGQISGEPNGSIFDVTSGAQSVTVVYNNSVLVCQGGQLANVNALMLGANVVVYSPIKKKGKTYQMTATKILVAGQPAGAIRGSAVEGTNFPQTPRGAAQPVNNYNPGMNQPAGTVYTSQNRGGSQIAATDDWNSPTGTNTQGGNQQGGGYPQGGASTSGQDNRSAGDSKGRSGSQNSNAISCSALDVSMRAGRDMATGQGVGRASARGITCTRAVDQLALQLFHDECNESPPGQRHSQLAEPARSLADQRRSLQRPIHLRRWRPAGRRNHVCLSEGRSRASAQQHARRLLISSSEGEAPEVPRALACGLSKGPACCALTSSRLLAETRRLQPMIS